LAAIDIVIPRHEKNSLRAQPPKLANLFEPFPGFEKLALEVLSRQPTEGGVAGKEEQIRRQTLLIPQAPQIGEQRIQHNRRPATVASRAAMEIAEMKPS